MYEHSCECIYCTAPPIDLSSTVKGLIVLHYQNEKKTGCFCFLNGKYIAFNGYKTSCIHKMINILKVPLDSITLKIITQNKVVHAPLSSLKRKLEMFVKPFKINIFPFKKCTYRVHIINSDTMSKLMTSRHVSKKRRKNIDTDEDLSNAPEISEFIQYPELFFHRKNRMNTLCSEPDLNKIISTRYTPGACPFVKCEWIVENNIIISEHAATALLMNPKYVSAVQEACSNIIVRTMDTTWDSID